MVDRKRERASLFWVLISARAELSAEVAAVLSPKLKKRTALFEKLREIFRQHVSWPIEVVIAKINPILVAG